MARFGSFWQAAFKERLGSGDISRAASQRFKEKNDCFFLTRQTRAQPAASAFA